MASFRTSFSIDPLRDRIKYTIFSIGSCFSENIGQKLIEHKYSILLNPFGILYNPDSILNALEAIGDKREYSKDDLVERDGLFHSFHHHGRFSHQNSDSCLKGINAELNCAHASFQEMDYLIITWGTASVFKWKDNNRTVANCHKFPADHFNRILLSVDDIANSYTPY